ncbi:MAG: hypothetical protein CMM75_01675 [Rhodospirillaceae bacterium]|nr:hypothetical protein [Rhodospirillaceae bacterium]|tara:strand:- start:658 stop:1215 length:558 start_codon:yes stop_codon:yes gene_type:complete
MGWSKLGRVVSTFLFGALLFGCGTEIKQEFPTIDKHGDVSTDVEQERLKKEQGRLFGGDALDFFNLGGSKKKSTVRSGISVNSFLWRATLDTISFLPLSSADPFGGVVLTDWYAPPKAPKERYKLSVFILSRQLRANGIRVAVHRQKLVGSVWRTSAVAKDTSVKLENQILMRARELRVASLKMK